LSFALCSSGGHWSAESPGSWRR